MFFLPTFAILFNEREEVHNISEGSLAQLVQSVCLTSRGSGVRIPQLPPKETPLQIAVKAFFFSLPSRTRGAYRRDHQENPVFRYNLLTLQKNRWKHKIYIPP